MGNIINYSKVAEHKKKNNFADEIKNIHKLNIKE
jgi:hypothetical protein